MHQTEGLPVRQIARVLRISRDAVLALAGDGPPQHGPRHAGSVADDELEPRVWPYRLPAGWRWATELDGPA
ncbi:MAG: hypothetical protein ACRDN1_08700 [Trebonia sp.]